MIKWHCRAVEKHDFFLLYDMYWKAGIFGEKEQQE